MSRAVGALGWFFIVCVGGGVLAFMIDVWELGLN